MDAFVIDAFAFCRLKEHREGEIAVAKLPRLAEESVDGAGTFRWSLDGGSDRFGHPQLNLSVSGSVRLMCQRCLTPFDFDISSDAVLILAEDEKHADEIDDLLASDAVEVIVGSTAFDIRQVIEDDVLLAIPLSPKHEICPDQLVTPAEPEEKKPSPFAVLKSLKK